MSKKKPQPTNENQDNESTGFRVSDKRFWQNESQETAGVANDIHRPSLMNKLEAQLADKEAQLEEHRGALRRLREEQRKSLKRQQNQQASELEGMKAELFASFLEIADNLERCLKTLEEENPQSETASGIRLIHQQFLNKLASQGATVIETVGKPFNPDHSEAISVEPCTSETQDNIVLAEYCNGFMIGDRLIRAAKVSVGQYSREKSSGQHNDSTHEGA